MEEDVLILRPDKNLASSLESVRGVLVTTHHCLDQLHSLVSDLVDDSRNVHHTLLSHLLPHMVYGDECPCSTHTSTERERESERESVCVRVCVCVCVCEREREREREREGGREGELNVEMMMCVCVSADLQ